MYTTQYFACSPRIKNQLNQAKGTGTLVPCSGGRMGPHLQPVRQGNFSSGSSSSGGNSGGGGGSALDDEGCFQSACIPAEDRCNTDQKHLRDILAEIRDAICHRESMDASEKITTFSIAEIRRIVVAAETTLERLIVALFISTGLRLGGLCRLQILLPGGRHLPRHARDVPKTLVTIEKGRKQRTVHINSVCRSELHFWMWLLFAQPNKKKGGGSTPGIWVLLAQWFCNQKANQGTNDTHKKSDNSCQPPVGQDASRGSFVFPGRTEGSPISRSKIWGLCRSLFSKAGVFGAHAHPHTFRHTVVKILFLTGNSFEIISKWIGHSSVTLTAGVYGKLGAADIQNQIQNVPFVESVTRTLPTKPSFLPCFKVLNLNETEGIHAWTELARFLHMPWPMPDEEMPESSKKRRIEQQKPNLSVSDKMFQNHQRTAMAVR